MDSAVNTTNIRHRVESYLEQLSMRVFKSLPIF